MKKIIILILLIIIVLLEFFVPIMILTEEGHKLNGRLDTEWLTPENGYKIYLFGRVEYINDYKKIGTTNRISILDVFKLIGTKIDSKNNKEVIIELKSFLNN